MSTNLLHYKHKCCVLISAMKINNQIRSVVTQGIRLKQMNKSDLSKAIGVDRSWVTRFFNGDLKSLTSDNITKLQDALNVKFYSVEGDRISPTARKIAELIEKDERLADMFNSLTLSLEDDHYYDLPHLPTKDLVDFGKEILRASHEDPNKPGKVGKIAITWLAKRLEKIKGSK